MFLRIINIKLKYFESLTGFMKTASCLFIEIRFGFKSISSDSFHSWIELYVLGCFESPGGED